jgi:hypothetical protein
LRFFSIGFGLETRTRKLEGVKKVELKICGGVIGIIAYNSKKMSNNSQNQNDNAVVDVIEVMEEMVDGTYEKLYREVEPSKVGQFGQDLYKVWEEDGTAIGYADEDMIFGVEGDGVYEEPDFSDVEGGDEEEEEQEINANSN